MHDLSQQLDHLLGRLEPNAASELEEAVRNAVKVAREKAEPNVATDAMGYPLGYFEATAGSFANEPLERPKDLPWESRESW